MNETGNRKIQSQRIQTWATLFTVTVYMVTMGFLKTSPEPWVIGIALGAIGGDAIAMKAANAVGDHGALKKGN